MIRTFFVKGHHFLMNGVISYHIHELLRKELTRIKEENRPIQLKETRITDDLYMRIEKPLDKVLHQVYEYIYFTKTPCASNSDEKPSHTDTYIKVYIDFSGKHAWYYIENRLNH